LFNFDPPATDEEVRAASLPFVRKVSSSTGVADQAAFDRAVDEIAATARSLVDSLVTNAEPLPRDRSRAHEGEGRRAICATLITAVHRTIVRATLTPT
jgi:hypothetical protein